MWLFGGKFNSSSGDVVFNDLWKYDVSENTWTWISGSSNADQVGTYGTKGTASTNNIPGARHGAVSWIDTNGDLWIFGGLFFSSIV